MNSIHYWLIAIGTVFTGVNIVINGLSIVFPTCFGFAMICYACWQLRDEDVIYKFASVPSFFLAIISFPDMFRYAIAQPPRWNILDYFYYYTFYPYQFGLLFVFAGIAVAIARLAHKWDREFLRYIALVSVAMILIVELSRSLFIIDEHWKLVAANAASAAWIAMFVWTAALAARQLP